MNDTNASLAPIQAQSNRTILLASILVALVFNFIGWMGVSTSKDYDFLQSTDDIVRMVMVRDWANGQRWFDPIIHRLGYEPGTVMHWSRLIDAPIRFLVSIGDLFIAGSGERFAAFMFPFIVFVAAYSAILTAVRYATGSSNLTTSAIIGGFAVWSWSTFQPGVIDHHHVQTALMLWLVVCLIPTQNDVFHLTLAGIITSVGLAIGIESLPIALAGALAVWLRLLLERETIYLAAQRYGLSLSLSIAVLYFALIGPENYSKTYCDSLSLFYLVCAGVGGLLLYVGLNKNVHKFLPAPHLSVPILSGVIVVLIAYLRFPQCLANPTIVDPLLKHFWLDGISEAQNILEMATASDRLQMIYVYALPIIAIGFVARNLVKRDEVLVSAILLIFLVITLLVTMFQIRGIKQLIPIAGLTLSIFMTRYMENDGKVRPLHGLIGLLLCCNLFWNVVSAEAMLLTDTAPSKADGKTMEVTSSLCQTQSDLDAVLAEKQGFVAGANGLGPWLLFKTNHRVLAGPYHRNSEGNIDSIKIMIGTESEAKAIIMKGGITMFMACPEFADEAQILKEVPNGFLGQLLAGKTPDWLEPVANTMDKPLKLWRVKPL